MQICVTAEFLQSQNTEFNVGYDTVWEKHKINMAIISQQQQVCVFCDLQMKRCPELY